MQHNIITVGNAIMIFKSCSHSSENKQQLHVTRIPPWQFFHIHSYALLSSTSGYYIMPIHSCMYHTIDTMASTMSNKLTQCQTLDFNHQVQCIAAGKYCCWEMSGQDVLNNWQVLLPRAAKGLIFGELLVVLKLHDNSL